MDQLAILVFSGLARHRASTKSSFCRAHRSNLFSSILAQSYTVASNAHLGALSLAFASRSVLTYLPDQSLAVLTRVTWVEAVVAAIGGTCNCDLLLLKLQEGIGGVVGILNHKVLLLRLQVVVKLVRLLV